MVWISEVLFYLTDGVALINTIWIFPWVIVSTLLLALPSTFGIGVLQSHKYLKYMGLIGIIAFLPVLTIIISPGAIQGQMMQECRSDMAELNVIKDGEPEINEEIEIMQCRYKDNYYGEFGEWEIVGLER